jgi:hypothetical protein
MCKWTYAFILIATQLNKNRVIITLIKSSFRKRFKYI